MTKEQVKEQIYEFLLSRREVTEIYKWTPKGDIVSFLKYKNITEDRNLILDCLKELEEGLKIIIGFKKQDNSFRYKAIKTPIEVAQLRIKKAKEQEDESL